MCAAPRRPESSPRQAKRSPGLSGRRFESPEGATETIPGEGFLSPLPGLNTNFLQPGAARFAGSATRLLSPAPVGAYFDFVSRLEL